MKYIMLIYQGSALERQAALPEEEQKQVYADYQGIFDLAEEAAQEAFAIAADRWPRDGVPGNPRAWLMRTARNRATDRIRRDRALATRFGLLERRLTELAATAG